MDADAAAIGVVLAGGAGSRMGGPKAGLRIGDGTLIERPLTALEAAGLRPVVVAKRDSPLPPVDAERWDEPAEPRHPLCGIVAALERAGGPIVVLACDMPFVPHALIADLASTPADAVVPAPAGGLEPLAARYGPAVIAPLRAALGEPASLRATVAALDPVTIADAELRRHGEPARMFANVNRPEDLRRLRAEDGTS